MTSAVNASAIFFLVDRHAARLWLNIAQADGGDIRIIFLLLAG
jgi:hypothetical protein